MRPRVAIAAAIVLAAACGGGDADEVDAGQADGTSIPEAVAERLRWSPPRLAPSLAVDGERLLAVGGLDQSDDGTSLQVAKEALLADLGSGEVTELPAPRADLPVEVIGVTADSSGFVVLGRRCEAGDRFPLDGSECLPGNGVAFRWDDARDDWAQLALPEDVSPAGADGLWTFQPVAVATDVDGATFVTARAGDPGGAGGPLGVPTFVLRLRGDRWETVARTEAPGVSAACATGDDYVLLANQAPSEPGPVPEEPTPVEGPSGPADVRLYSVPRGGGELVSVGLPELDTSFGGVSIHLACDRRGPYLTSSSPRLGSDMRMYARRDGEWVDVSRDWGTAIAVRTASSAAGVAVVVEQVADQEGQAAYIVGSDDPEARRGAAELTERLFVPAGPEGGWMTVGPLAELSTASDLAAERPDDQLTITELVP